MNRLFDPPPAYPPTELVSVLSVLAGLVKFVSCVLYFFMMNLGFRLFNFEDPFYSESGRLLWVNTTSRRPSSFAQVNFIGFSPLGVNPVAGGTIPAKLLSRGSARPRVVTIWFKWTTSDNNRDCTPFYGVIIRASTRRGRGDCKDPCHHGLSFLIGH